MITKNNAKEVQCGLRVHYAKTGFMQAIRQKIRIRWLADPNVQLREGLRKSFSSSNAQSGELAGNLRC
jgi:hypothetical protein